MTEEKAQWIDKIVPASGVLSLMGLAAYVFEQARASAYGGHFGVHHSAADPRSAAISLLGIGLALALSAGTVWLAVRAGSVSLPAGLVTAAIGGALFGRLAGSVLEGVAVVAAYTVTVALLVWCWRSGRAVVLGRASAYPDGPTAKVVDAVRRVGSALNLPWYVSALGAAFVVLWAAWIVGGWTGKLGAENRTDFDVTHRDASTATVIFTRTGDIVERVLDVSPGPDGKPLNVWKPGVTIRPMPDAGITFRTERLGETQRAKVS